MWSLQSVPSERDKLSARRLSRCFYLHGQPSTTPQRRKLVGNQISDLVDGSGKSSTSCANVSQIKRLPCGSTYRSKRSRTTFTISCVKSEFRIGLGLLSVAKILFPMSATTHSKINRRSTCLLRREHAGANGLFCSPEFKVRRRRLRKTRKPARRTW